MIEILIFLVLLTVGFFVGRRVEKEHYRSIIQRERDSIHFPVSSLGTLDPKSTIENLELLSAIAVLSPDYFKLFASKIKSLFGGRINVYETLIDRARRESILRLKEKAMAKGYNAIIQLRIETSSISGSKMNTTQSGVSSIEVIAYGTAVQFN